MASIPWLELVYGEETTGVVGYMARSKLRRKGGGGDGYVE
jgi:hypothetical protein